MTKANRVKTFTSCTSQLKCIREFVADACHSFAFSEQKTNDVVLAIDEACANVIRHGYKMCDQGCVIIDISLQGDNAIFLIKDNCPQITEQKLQPVEHDLCEPGGLGLCLIRSVADQVRLIPHGGKGNWLELTIKLE